MARHLTWQVMCLCVRVCVCMSACIPIYGWMLFVFLFVCVTLCFVLSCRVLVFFHFGVSVYLQTVGTVRVGSPLLTLMFLLAAGCPEDAAAQKIGEAVLTSAAVAATAAVKADHTAAGREAAAATRSPAPPASTAVRSPLIQVAIMHALNCSWYCSRCCLCLPVQYLTVFQGTA